jgi:WD40 repeat protein
MGCDSVLFTNGVPVSLEKRNPYLLLTLVLSSLGSLGCKDGPKEEMTEKPSASIASKPVTPIPDEPFAHCPYFSDSATLAIRRKSPVLVDRAFSFLLSPSACLAVVQDTSGSVTLWDIPSGRARAIVEAQGKLPTGHRSPWANLGGLALSADESLVATGFEDGEVRVWNANSGEVVRRLSQPPFKEAYPKRSAFGKDASTLLVVYRVRNSRPSGEIVSVWDVRSGTLLRQKVLPAGNRGFDWAHKGDWYATPSLDSSISVWNIETDEEHSISLPGKTTADEAVLFPQSHLILLRTTNGVELWDYKAKERRYLIKGCRDGSEGADLRVEGQMYLMRCKGKVVLRDVATGVLVRTIESELANDNVEEVSPIHDGRHPEVDFKNEGALVQLLGIDGRAQIWDVKTGTMIDLFAPPNPPENMWMYSGGAQSSSNGRFTLTIKDNFFVVWDTKSKKAVRSYAWVP